LNSEILPKIILREREPISHTSVGKALNTRYDAIDVYLGASELLATDARDKVCAFLGLAEELNGNIKPDYSLTIQRTYQKLGECFISLGLGSSIIATADLARLDSKDLPSWCLDLSHSGKCAALFQYAKVYKWSLRASGDSPGLYRVGPALSELTVSGIIFDTITALGPAMIEPPDSNHVEVMLHWIQDTRKFI
jgi:hypothetical protein